MQRKIQSSFISSFFFLIRECSLRKIRGICLALLVGSAVFAQDGEEGAPPAGKDPFDLEAEFITHLLDEGLFVYANLALEETRKAFPELADRIQVVEVSTLLRQGKTAEVEEILSGKDLKTDMKSQAMLLQLAMTYDAMGKNDPALTKYQEFLTLNEGKEIEDPDVLRYFASAALRLSHILKEAGNFEEAAKVLQLVIDTTEDSYLVRKFQLLAAQNRVDQALAGSGDPRKTALAAANAHANDLLYGGNDNFFYMAVGIKAWIEFIEGKPEEALATLNKSKNRAIEMEQQLNEGEVPKSEYPRPIMRYVEGRVQWSLARDALKNGDEAGMKQLAARALGNFYNTFLNYEGNEYADRAALSFEDLNDWVEEVTGKRPAPSNPSPRIREKMFDRELDLAEKLYREGELENAREKVLEALGEFPNTPYTVQALDTLSKIWIDEEQDWELIALAQQVGDSYEDTEAGARIMLRIGKKMADGENVQGFNEVMRAFGRNFPSHPQAPRMLFRVGESMVERGDKDDALDVYDEILEFYPQSNYAVRVLRLRADEALNVENYEEAIKAFAQVRDQAREPLAVAYAKLRIADSKLKSRDPELEEQAVPELKALRDELGDPHSVYAQEENAEKAQEFLQNVRYRIGQVLLRKASVENSDELREEVAAELNSFLNDYPDSENAPDVMFNLGRLYLQKGEFDNATTTFEKLARDYEDSDAGRDALYSLVKAALEENQVQVAQEAVQKMVAQPESYEIEKIYRVAQLMLENEQWEEARRSFRLVLENEGSKDNPNMEQRALQGMGEASLGEDNLDQAAESFQALIDKFPNSSLVMDAGLSLSEVYLKKDPPGLEKATQALSAVARIHRNLDGSTSRAKVAKARLDIALGNLYMAQGEPGKALSNWFTVGLTEPEPDDLQLGELVREAIVLALDESQRQIEEGNRQRWNLVRELTDQYIRAFPMHKSTDQMRSLNLRAINQSPEEN